MRDSVGWAIGTHHWFSSKKMLEPSWFNHMGLSGYARVKKTDLLPVVRTVHLRE